MSEQWEPIKDYEGLYEVSDKGNVRSILTTKSRRKRLLKPYEKNGYLAVNLFKNSKAKHHYIHRLVAKAFIPYKEGKTEVNHIDCDKHNNTVENLEWSSRKENLQHSYNNGLKREGEKHGGHKLIESEVLQIKKEYKRGDPNCSYNALARKYKVHPSTIQAIIAGRIWRHLEKGVI